MFKSSILLTFMLSAATSLAAPDVTQVTAKQRFPWNGLVDVKCTVEGYDNSGEFKFSVKAVNGDSGNVYDASSVWMIRNGGKSSDLIISVNGEYHLLWDAKADLGETVCSNMQMRVTLKRNYGGVQLWKDGPYWAECNIGATKPEEYGCYFWWGDTVGYRREGDKWVATDGSSSNFSFGGGNTPTYGKNKQALLSEGYIDASGNLAAAHDAATAHLGAPWRMPTDAEFSALISNCTITWTTRNGVYGRLVTGEGTYADRSIFLPAAGYGAGLYDAGSSGLYWSSTPDSGDSNDCAWGLHFDSGYFGRFYDNRDGGRSVRPVRGFAE